MRPIGLGRHQMEGKVELTHLAMLSPQEGSGELIEQAATKAGSLAIEMRAAQKVFGWLAGGSIHATGAYGKGSNDVGLF